MSHQKLLLFVRRRVTGHSVKVHQISQHAVAQHWHVRGDGCQRVAHENARGVTGQVELAEQELHHRLAEMGPAFQQFHQ